MLVVALPQIFCDDANSNDNEKYTHTNMPSSLYCNDLNPQMHIDFNMVNLIRVISQLTFDSFVIFYTHTPDIFNKKFAASLGANREFLYCCLCNYRKFN